MEICNAVLDVWQPTAENKVIINLPVTVAHSMPHVYANQVAYMCKNLKNRENVIVSLHAHNDRGCAIADSEMGLLAGGDRIEGTLFGNGERTGNVDIITLALNVYQLAVTVDDGEAGVTEVVRGMDLLGSAPRQMYLQQLFGFAHPTYGHVPMLLSADGRRLSKRDRDLDLGELRKRMRPQELLGQLAYAAGMLERYEPVSAVELASLFSWDSLRKEAITIDVNNSCFFP